MDLMTQVREAKERHPGMVFMFRVGDFYEMFADDAEIGRQVLGLPVAIRYLKSWAGFPHHSLEGHLRKLLQAGHRVAICDQIQNSDLPPMTLPQRIVVPAEAIEPESATLFDLMD